MKQYDLYVVMAPSIDSEAHLEALTNALFNSGLKCARHIGDKGGMAARRDIERLVNESRSLLYVSDEATNSLETSSDAVRDAERLGIPIYVLRFDNSDYRYDIADTLAHSKVYDAVFADRRPDIIDAFISHLGGNIAPDVTEDERPTTPDAQPTTGPQTVEDVEEDETRVIRRPQSTWTIVIEIILGLVIIAGIIALAVK